LAYRNRSAGQSKNPERRRPDISLNHALWAGAFCDGSESGAKDEELDMTR
jgi:hypothetical protein